MFCFMPPKDVRFLAIVPLFIAVFGITGCGESSSSLRKNIAMLSEENEKTKNTVAELGRRVDSLTAVRDGIMATTGEPSKFQEKIAKSDEELASLKNQIETAREGSEKLGQIVKSLQTQLFK